MTARLDGCEDVWQIMVPFCMSCSIFFDGDSCKFREVKAGSLLLAALSSCVLVGSVDA